MENLTELLLAAKAGDEASFEVFLKATEKDIYHYAYSLTKHAEDAADVAQEAYIRLWRSLGHFRGDCSAETWMYRITKTAALDFLRARSRRPRAGQGTVNEEGEEILAGLPDPGDTPAEAYLKKERAETLKKAFASLPFGAREILFLREAKGLSYEEISRILSLPVGTVRSRLARARQNLKETLEKGNFFT